MSLRVVCCVSLLLVVNGCLLSCVCLLFVGVGCLCFLLFVADAVVCWSLSVVAGCLFVLNVVCCCLLLSLLLVLLGV